MMNTEEMSISGDLLLTNSARFCKQQGQGRIFDI